MWQRRGGESNGRFPAAATAMWLAIRVYTVKKEGRIRGAADRNFAEAKQQMRVIAQDLDRVFVIRRNLYIVSGTYYIPHEIFRIIYLL